MNDTTWRTLFWSLMNELQEVDTDEAMLMWERYEVAAMQLEAEGEQE